MKGAVKLVMNEYLYKEYKFVTGEINRLTEQLAALPEGKLTIQKNGKYDKWYYRKGDEKRHLKKPQEAELAQGLAQRSFFEKKQAVLTQEEKYLEKCIAIQKATADVIYREFAEGTAMGNLVRNAGPAVVLDSQNVAAWQAAPFDQLALHPEAKKYKT